MTDKFYNDVELSDEVKQAIKHFDNLEHYQTAQLREHCVSYDDEKLENRLFNSTDNVEFIAEHEKQLSALKKALTTLSSEDLEIIRENFFFEEKKPSYTELANKYGVTRQVYTRKLNRILAKLKMIVENYLNID